MEWYGKNGIRRVRDIPMNSKADFAAQKGLITEELRKEICDAYHLRSNNHVDREIRTNYVPSTSDAQKTFETLERFISQLKAHLDKPEPPLPPPPTWAGCCCTTRKGLLGASGGPFSLPTEAP